MHRRSWSVLALAVALIVGPAVQAQAKGPESVTLAGPGIDEPIELINASKSFDTYENEAPLRLLDMTGLGTGPRLEAVSPSGDAGPAYTLTWVNMGPPGDPIDERTFHLYIYLDEAPEALAATIDEVIAWSATEEAAAIRSGTAPPPSTATAPIPEDTSAPKWLALIPGMGVGALLIWLLRQPLRSTWDLLRRRTPAYGRQLGPRPRVSRRPDQPSSSTGLAPTSDPSWPGTAGKASPRRSGAATDAIVYDVPMSAEQIHPAR